MMAVSGLPAMSRAPLIEQRRRTATARAAVGARKRRVEGRHARRRAHVGAKRGKGGRPQSAVAGGREMNVRGRRVPTYLTLLPVDPVQLVLYELQAFLPAKPL